ncbi:MAG: phosphoglycerate kinase [Candidatus Rokuibacteriota bacterium]|nr:MAG: phosphoglycerate kinase [Candidatus Rokubacteria bacterium]
MMKLSVVQLDLRGRRVFLRADFNVSLAGDEITDDTRIRAVIPTLEYCLQSGASVVLGSHLGRPEGRRDARYSLKPVVFRLEELLGRPIPLAPDCVGSTCEKLAAALEPGQCLLLENLRFHPEEEANDRGFAQALARLGDCYVNEAFSVCHRAHASVSAITRFLQPAATGLLMQRELLTLSRLMNHPKRPLVLILGGARMSDKLGLIGNLLSRVDRLLIGGAMAFTFLKALGHETGRSLVEQDLLPTAKQILAEAFAKNVEVLLPEDLVIATYPQESASAKQWPAVEIPIGMTGLDLGTSTLARYREVLRDAGTVIWNGPVGMFERPAFANGTAAVAKMVAEAPGLTVAAGTDTAAAVRRAGVADRITYVSTAGAAFLEGLEGRELPGVAALKPL